MKKSWKLIDKILSGTKKIESRWYMARIAPWDRINEGDKVYFKDAGQPVTAKADVERVIQYDNYSEDELRKVLEMYGKDISFRSPLDDVFEWARKRKYCILIFLKNPQKVGPFNIDKTGFGCSCAWVCINSIEEIKQKNGTAEI